MALFGRGRDREDRRRLGSSSIGRNNSVRTASTNIVVRPRDEEQTFLKESGNWLDVDNAEDRRELRDKIRRYSMYNDAMNVVITLTSMFASSGPKIVCEDAQNEAVLNEYFESHGMAEFLYEFIREYLISGEATSFASWDEDGMCLTDEQILDPDQIEVTPSLWKDDDHIVIAPPDAVAEVFMDESNPDHYEAVSEMPELYEAISAGKPLRVDDEKIIRIVNRAKPWDRYGTPMFTPALSALVQEEALDAALYEQLYTLITPTIIGTVGLKAGELGPNSSPWVPTQDQLDQIAETYRNMMMARFRLGLFTIGVDFKNAFANAQIPDLSKDYARCEQKILRCVAAGKGLLDGSSGGPWASGALNRDVYASVIQFIRDKVSHAFQKRIDTVIHRLGIVAYRPNDDGERVRVLTEDGKPVYETAFLDFDHGVMRNANDQMDVLIKLADKGVPISWQTLADSAESGIQVAEEIRSLKDEQDLQKKVGMETDPIIEARERLSGDGDEEDDAEPRSPLNIDAM